jgi:Ser/Thr protein kinase RdoA (MazF antagonist)
MNVPPNPLFDLYPADTRPITKVAMLGNAGGLSGASLYRFRAGRGELVARRWPDGRRTLPAVLANIHDWVARAGDLGFVPVPLPTLDGRTIVELGGRIWEIAPWMPGTADLARPPSRDHLRLAFGGLAAFLSRLGSGTTHGLSPGLGARVAEIEGLMLGEFARISNRLELFPTDPASPMARRWLDRAIALAPAILESTRVAASRPLPRQPCLRDPRPDHFLFEGDRLTGLVDFGAMGVESVAGDLARLLGEWVGPDRAIRGEALASFEAIRPLSDAELRAIEAFERANALLGPLAWIYWHFFDGRVFDEPDTVVKGLTRRLERLDEAT